MGASAGMIHGAVERPAADRDVDVRPPVTLEPVADDDILRLPARHGRRHLPARHAPSARLPVIGRRGCAAVRAAARRTVSAGSWVCGRARANERMAPLDDREDGRHAVADRVCPRTDRARRLDELEFHLPSTIPSAAQLSRALERFGYPPRHLASGNSDATQRIHRSVRARRRYTCSTGSRTTRHHACVVQAEAFGGRDASMAITCRYLPRKRSAGPSPAPAPCAAAMRATHRRRAVPLRARRSPGWQADGQPAGRVLPQAARRRKTAARCRRAAA
jgi:hypothetical protein